MSVTSRAEEGAGRDRSALWRGWDHLADGAHRGVRRQTALSRRSAEAGREGVRGVTGPAPQVTTPTLYR